METWAPLRGVARAELSSTLVSAYAVPGRSGAREPAQCTGIGSTLAVLVQGDVAPPLRCRAGQDMAQDFAQLRRRKADARVRRAVVQQDLVPVLVDDPAAWKDDLVEV